MSLPRYPEYRESGVEWLGNIPKHWSVLKFRHAFTESSEKIDIEVIGVMLSVSGYRGIEIKEYDDENRRRLDEELVGYRIVRPGQLVVNTMWLNYAGLGVSEHEGHVSPAYRSYWIAPEFNKRYVHHMMRCDSFVRGYTKFLTGIRPNSLQMSREDLMAFQLLSPPVEEQTTIATFLDRETARIDALIAEQEKLIALLAEKRQATISHAVTRGLDPDVPMKNSGVAWLGEVPGHWRTGKIQAFARRESGHTPSRQHPEYWENCSIPWFSLADVWQIRDGNVKYVHETRELISELGLAKSSARLLPAGTVILSRTASVGYSAIMGRDMATTQDFVNWVCGPDLQPEFLLYVLRGMKTEFDRLMMGSTHQTIYMPDIAKLAMALPPSGEQAEIIQFLDVEIAKLDTLKSEANRAITLLKERRSALIAAAVTGQIDVRGVVSQEVAA